MEVEHPFQLTWAELPIEPILRVFSFLDVKDLCACNQVNHHWRAASEKDENWRPHFQKWFSIKDEKISSPNDSVKETFEKHYKTWTRYRYVYAKVRNVWDQVSFPYSVQSYGQDREDFIEEITKNIRNTSSRSHR